MENEKESEKVNATGCCGHDKMFFQHRFSPLRMCIMFCGMVIIFGGVFALGRISADHQGLGRANNVRGIQIERGGMMGRGSFE
ncbi:MAG: hypothetical protein WCO23_04580, partial [bacterium]